MTHSFVVIPNCPYPLMGRDLLTKVGAHIHFKENRVTVFDKNNEPIHVLTLNLVDEYKLVQEITPPNDQKLQASLLEKWIKEIPGIWAEIGGPGLAQHHAPIIVQLKTHATPVHIKQYPIPLEAKKGIMPHIQKLKEMGILTPCQSAWNTPLLPFQKPNSEDYRPVQDLREVNKWVEDIHPTVPNP